jgi:hypothetical protein
MPAAALPRAASYRRCSNRSTRRSIALSRSSCRASGRHIVLVYPAGGFGLPDIPDEELHHLGGLRIEFCDRVKGTKRTTKRDRPLSVSVSLRA